MTFPPKRIRLAANSSTLSKTLVEYRNMYDARKTRVLTRPVTCPDPGVRTIRPRHISWMQRRASLVAWISLGSLRYWTMASKLPRHGVNKPKHRGSQTVLLTPYPRQNRRLLSDVVCQLMGDWMFPWYIKKSDWCGAHSNLVKGVLQKCLHCVNYIHYFHYLSENKNSYRFFIFHKFGRFIHKVTISSITRILIHKSFGRNSGGSQRMA
jgi:hypothetical protein